MSVAPPVAVSEPVGVPSMETVALANRLRPVLLHLVRHLRREARSSPITAGQLEILALVNGRPGVGVNELAALVGISPPSMSNAVDKLEAAGLAARSREEGGDRRRVGLAVTAAGARAVRAARSSRTAWLAERLARLTPEQLDALDSAVDALSAMLGDPPQR